MSIADGNSAAHDGVPASEETANVDGNGTGSTDVNASQVASAQPSLHRLATIRRRQGMSQRTVARRLGVDVAAVCQQEQETTDLPLSLIYAWQKALDTPAAELLIDSDAPLSSSVLNRARLVRVMKTAASIREKAHSSSLKRLVATIIEELLEIMPELREVGAWNTVGHRRTLDEFGQAVMRQLPDDFFRRIVR